MTVDKGSRVVGPLRTKEAGGPTASMARYLYD